jgi:phosphoenolpyruvate synthase/pyruvate phosphate dikinase
MIMSSKFPQDLEDAIVSAYKELAVKLNIDVSDLDVAVRSSATAEDLANCFICRTTGIIFKCSRQSSCFGSN